MKITARLNSADLKRAADDVKQYANDLTTKVQQVLQRLADKGITTAEQTVGWYGNYITFSKQTDNDGVIIVAQEVGVIVSEWVRYGQPVYAEVSPLLMAEFGAGNHAVVWQGVLNETNTLPDGKKIGRGTFPNQTHAFESYWHYMDMSGNWQTVNGLSPTRPLYNAVIEIISTVNATAREVFGNG